MGDEVQSIVIVTGALGSIASLRFANSRDDIDIADKSEDILYERIEHYVWLKSRRRRQF